jgi:GDP-L-fucose synthase
LLARSAGTEWIKQMNASGFDLKGRRVWVAGHGGMVGSALLRRLEKEDCELLTVNRTSLDLRRQADVDQWIMDKKPDVIFLAAAKVGGIKANYNYPAEFLYDNLLIEANVIEAACRNNIAKLIFLGSSCIYPKLAPQPISEESLLTGALEPTNQWYAVAKISGLKLAEAYRRQYGCDFISAMPTNLYGPEDNFDLETSHVLPALIRKFHEAKVRRLPEVSIWGTGAPRREFLHVDDCADALVFLVKNYSDDSHINVGTGWDLTILELASMVAATVGFEGGISRDVSKPDGTPRKLLDISRLRALGWAPTVDLKNGIAATYIWYQEHCGSL